MNSTKILNTYLTWNLEVIDRQSCVGSPMEQKTEDTLELIGESIRQKKTWQRYRDNMELMWFSLTAVVVLLLEEEETSIYSMLLKDQLLVFILFLV